MLACVFGRMSATDPAAATAAADVLSNPHLLAAILEQLARASDLAHATAVSTAWCQEGCANALWRAHCLRSFPQLAGLLVAGADFRRLFIGQARSLHRPFRAPTPPELSPHGLRFLVHIERATRFNHRRGFRTVASATLPAAGSATLNEEHVSFAWPLALKRSALRRVGAEPEDLAPDEV